MEILKKVKLYLGLNPKNKNPIQNQKKHVFSAYSRGQLIVKFDCQFRDIKRGVERRHVLVGRRVL